MADNKVIKAKFKRSYIYGLAGALAVFTIAYGLISYFTHSGSYVARIGRERITTAEYNLFFKQEKDYMLALLDMDEEVFPEAKIEGERVMDIARRRALESAQEYKLQYIKAKEAGFKLTREDNENIENSLKSHIPSEIRSEAERDEYFIRTTGVTYNELTEIIKKYELIRRFQDEEIASIVPDEKNLKEYYRLKRNNYDNITLQHIFIPVDEGLAEEDTEKFEKDVMEFFERALSGEDLNRLAKEINVEAHVDNIYRNDSFPEELKEWGFSSNEGDMDVVKSQKGYFVLKLLNKSATYEDLNEEFLEMLKESYIEQQYRDIINEWKQEPRYKMTINHKVYDTITK